MSRERWRRVPLAAVCANADDIKCGPFGTQLGKDEFRSEGVPLWGIKQVNANFAIPTKEFLEPRTANRLRQYELRSGDIVMTRKGTVGNCAIYPPRFETGIMHSDLLRLRVDIERCEPAFLVHQLHHSPDVERQLSLISGGAIMPGINVGRLKQLEVVLPPLAEQRRIAEVLDRAETLRTKRRAVLARLDTLTQSIFLELFGDPGTNTKGWPKGALGDVATFIGGGTPSRARPEFFEGSICWATSKDMKCEFLEDTEEHITTEAIEQSATTLVPAGTILVVVKSKILAHSLPVATARVPTCFGQDLKGIKVSTRCEVVFVTTALRSGKRWLLERARGINTEGLTLDHLKAFPLVLPPIELQQEFARRVTAVEKLKSAQRASLSELDALFASLQHRAFRGEL